MAKDNSPRGMTVREAGKKGGEIVKEKYGPKFYETIGRKGGMRTQELKRADKTARDGERSTES